MHDLLHGWCMAFGGGQAGPCMVWCIGLLHGIVHGVGAWHGACVGGVLW